MISAVVMVLLVVVVTVEGGCNPPGAGSLDSIDTVVHGNVISISK